MTQPRHLVGLCGRATLTALVGLPLGMIVGAGAGLRSAAIALGVVGACIMAAAAVWWMRQRGRSSGWIRTRLFWIPVASTLAAWMLARAAGAPDCGLIGFAFGMACLGGLSAATDSSSTS